MNSGSRHAPAPVAAPAAAAALLAQEENPITMMMRKAPPPPPTIHDDEMEEKKQDDDDDNDDHRDDTANNNDNEDRGSDSDDDDDDDRECSIHQLRKSGGGGSIRRNDSFTNFMTRSERAAAAAAAAGDDDDDERAAPPAAAAAGKRSRRRRRRVRFPDAPSSLARVHEIDDVPDDCRDMVWLTDSDFDRMDSEISLTMFRWENHVVKKFQFDESANTVRGLEHMVAARCGGAQQQQQQQRNDDHLLNWNHARNVLQEVRRQKVDDGRGWDSMDWEKIRNAALRISTVSAEKAKRIGLEDQRAKEMAWKENGDSNHSSSNGNGSSLSSSSSDWNFDLLPRRAGGGLRHKGKKNATKKMNLNVLLAGTAKALMFWKKQQQPAS